MTDTDLQALETLPHLEVLILQSPVHHPKPNLWPGRRQPFSAGGLSSLGKLTQLRQLSLGSDFLTDEGTENLAQATGLISLSLNGHIGNQTLQAISLLPNLKRLSLTGEFDDTGLQHLASLSHLECLDVASPQLTGSGFSALAKLSHLRYLQIRHPGLHLSLTSLERWPALEVLHLGSETITDSTFQTLPEFPYLTSLCLLEAPLTDQSVTTFRKFPRLEELNLRRTHITDAGLEELSLIPSVQQNLRILCLGDWGQYHQDPHITQTGLQQLARLRHLTELDLRGINLQQVNLQTLAFPSLRKLNIEGLGPAEIRRRSPALLKRLPLLDRNFDSRILIRADLFGEHVLTAYDFALGRLQIEL